MPTLVASPPATLSIPASLLDDAEVGLLHLRPVYAPGDPTELVDLTYLRLNPAAQRLLRLPEVPIASFRTLHPQAEADFAFYRDTFLAGTVRSCNLQYPSGWQARAQRHGHNLVVSLMANTPPLSELPAQVAATRLAASSGALARTQLAARQLAQERDALHQLLAQTPTPICLLRGLEYRFEYVNPAFARLFAHRALEGLPAAEVLPEALNQGFMTLLDRVYETGETLLEAELRLPDSPPDSPRYFNFTYQAHLENGHADRLSVFAYEVTEQVRARQQVQQLNQVLEARVAERTQQLEVALHETEQQQVLLRQLLEQLPAAVATLAGPEHRFSFFNDRYQALVSHRAQLDQRVAESLPELQEQGFIDILDRVYATSQPQRGLRQPVWLQQPDNAAPILIHVDYLYQPLKDAQGQTQGILAFIVEVAEQLPPQTPPDTGLPQLRRLFEQAPLAVVVLAGPTYLVEMATPAMCALWSCTQEQVLGQPLAAALPELATPAFQQVLADVRCTGVAYVAQEQAVQRWQQGKPETCYLDLACQPLADAQGQVIAVAVVAVDVSARVAAQRQLARANEDLRATTQQLTRTNAAQDNHIQTALHNLQTPLANLESLLVVLRQQLPAEARQAGLVPQVLNMMQSTIHRFQLATTQLANLPHAPAMPEKSRQHP